MHLIPLEHIPDTLKQRKQWIVYGKRDSAFDPKYITDKNNHQKLDKTPYNPMTERKAQSNNPASWTDFQTALEAYESGLYNGIGFVFAEGDELAGIDLDHVLNPDTLQLEPQAQEILHRFHDSYVEISPSGDGLHIWVKGEPERCGKGTLDKRIEVYHAKSARYFTVTGNKWNGCGTEPIEAQDALNWLHVNYFDESLKPKPAPKSSKTAVFKAKKTSPQTGTHFDVSELLSIARHDTKFTALWEGDISGYPSQSEADSALCFKLAYYLQGNPESMDAAFRHSQLMRDKWDTPHLADGTTYGAETIDKACAHVTEYYRQKPEQFALTDIGNGRRLIHYYGDKVRYCPLWDKWLIWNQRYWELDHTLKIEQFAKRTVKWMYQEAEKSPADRADALRKWAHQSESVSKLKNLLHVARSELAITPEMLDRQGMQLNCRNGTLDLTRGELTPHRQQDYHTRMLPVDYDPDVECPLWLTFLNQIFAGDQELIAYLQRAIGYSLTSSIAEQCIFIMYGTGANGKSTFVDTIEELLGEYSKTAAPDLLLTKNSNAHPTGIADLQGARFVSVMESGKGQKLDENLVKQMTGDSKLKARFMRQDFFEFPVEFKLWMATNHKPVIKGNDYAIWRRIILIPFTVTIQPEKRDKKLLAKLKAELPGILNWALQGCLEWQRREGLEPPAKVLKAIQEYHDEEDILTQFIREKCLQDESHRILNTDLYQAYVKYCQNIGSLGIFGVS